MMRVLNTPDLEVKKKTLDLAIDLTSNRNIHDVVQVLQKEIGKTSRCAAVYSALLCALGGRGFC